MYSSHKHNISSMLDRSKNATLALNGLNSSGPVSHDLSMFSLYLILDAGFDVGLEDVGDALGGLHWHRTLLHHDLGALGNLRNASCARLHKLEVGRSTLVTRERGESVREVAYSKTGTQTLALSLPSLSSTV